LTQALVRGVAGGVPDEDACGVAAAGYLSESAVWDIAGPFEFDAPVSPEDLIGRRVEADTIRAWAGKGSYMALVAPRPMARRA
jgi:hypothetical protein